MCLPEQAAAFIVLLLGVLFIGSSSSNGIWFTYISRSVTAGLCWIGYRKAGECYLSQQLVYLFSVF
jgi:hypothetical protein